VPFFLGRQVHLDRLLRLFFRRHVGPPAAPRGRI
jgi:hypothetical protein